MSAAIAVAIQLSVELAPELADKTVSSCRAALGAEHCRLADDSPDPEPYRASVTSEVAQDDVVHIVVSRHTDGATVAERAISFLPEDAPAERWASVGVVIAALVTSAGQSEPVSPKPSLPPPPRPRAPRPKPPPPQPEHPLRIDVLARLSRETATDFPQELGGVARGSFLFVHSPVFVTVAAGYAARGSRQPLVSFPLVAAGGGFRWGRPRARWAAELSLDGIAECWILSASKPGKTDADSVWRFGGALGLDGIYAASPAVQVVAGLGGEILTPGVAVDVLGKPREKMPVGGGTLVLGVRLVP